MRFFTILPAIFMVGTCVAHANDKRIDPIDSGQIRICDESGCAERKANDPFVLELMRIYLNSSHNKSFKTCQYAMSDKSCTASFISFPGKGIGIFEGRAGFRGFKILSAVDPLRLTVKIAIDNYPWVFGKELNEQNVDAVSHQVCEETELLIESDSKALRLSIPEYRCKGRVYGFKNSLLMTLRELNLKTGEHLFTYEIRMRDGATGNGSGHTTLQFDRDIPEISTLHNLSAQGEKRTTKSSINNSIASSTQPFNERAQPSQPAIAEQPTSSQQRTFVDSKQSESKFSLAVNKQQGPQESEHLKSKTAAILKLNSGDEVLGILPGLWSQECENQDFAKIRIARPHRFELTMTWQSGDGSRVLQRAKTKNLLTTSKVDLARNHFEILTEMNEADGIAKLYQGKLKELTMVLEIHDTNKFRFFKMIEDRTLRVENGINLQSNSESKFFHRCADNPKREPLPQVSKIMDNFGILLYLQVAVYESSEAQWRFLSTKYGAPSISQDFSRMIKSEVPEIWKQVSTCYKKFTGADMTRETIRKFIDSEASKYAKEVRPVIQVLELGKGTIKIPNTKTDLNEASSSERMTRLTIDEVRKILNTARGQNFCENIVR
jgi:hypothetical protein